jgi:hypothetical protein
MQAGPGIILIANDANVSIDENGNRRGLLFSQKSRLPGSNQERLRTVLHSALENCRRLEEEPALRGKLRFTVNEAVISLNNRLLGANSQEAFDELKGDVEVVAGQLLGGAKFKLERDSDSSRRLNVYLKSSATMSSAQALNNLRQN